MIALGALGLVAAAVAVVILTTRGGSSTKHHSATAAQSGAAASSGKLRGALTPLVSANHRLSNVLAAVNPSQSVVVSAKSAASAAQTALATARGAVGALTTPSSDRTLSEQVQQAFDNENGYVQAVSATLADPHSSQASQLQTLATSLQSSLVPLDSVAAGASASVSGTSSLTSWANGAAARARHRAARAQPNSSSSSAGSTASSGSSSSNSSGLSSSPYANGEDCGGGLYAGPNTSCPFAENVQQAYDAAPGANATVQVYSPVTNQTYSMSCSPAGSGITCSGANNASVSW